MSELEIVYLPMMDTVEGKGGTIFAPVIAGAGVHLSYSKFNAHAKMVEWQGSCGNMGEYMEVYCISC